MEAWLESPGHRAIILDCDLTKLGVASPRAPAAPGGPSSSAPDDLIASTEHS
jgi:uncharacterized protein YkwD